MLHPLDSKTRFFIYADSQLSDAQGSAWLRKAWPGAACLWAFNICILDEDCWVA